MKITLAPGKVLELPEHGALRRAVTVRTDKVHRLYRPYRIESLAPIKAHMLWHTLSLSQQQRLPEHFDPVDLVCLTAMVEQGLLERDVAARVSEVAKRQRFESVSTIPAIAPSVIKCVRQLVYVCSMCGTPEEVEEAVNREAEDGSRMLPAVDREQSQMLLILGQYLERNDTHFDNRIEKLLVGCVGYTGKEPTDHEFVPLLKRAIGRAKAVVEACLVESETESDITGGSDGSTTDDSGAETEPADGGAESAHVSGE